MIPPSDDELVHGYKFSSVGPGRATGQDVDRELRGADLALKLHYLRGVYFFRGEAVEGLSNQRVKETMFYWLNIYFHACGRLRRSEAGRPYIKCNDCGARFLEATCERTVAEWLAMEDWPTRQRLLVSQQVIGPELSFSPPVLVQITHFRCGGISLGLSWAHLLGDAFSAADFINKWAQIATSIQSHGPPKTPPLPVNPNPILTPLNQEDLNKVPEELPRSLKLVDPVGDHWVINDSEMETMSFHLSPAQITNLKAKALGPFFESLCAIIWRSIAKVRRESEPKIVTLLKPNPKRDKGVLTNSQIVSTVGANFPPKDADPRRLAALLAAQEIDETREIDRVTESDRGLSDFIVYGANLTFVDWQKVDFYDMELQGHKPDFVSYNVQGVGQNGAVFVLPGSKDSDGFEKIGRLVTIIVPGIEISELKSELKKHDLLLENNIE